MCKQLTRLLDRTADLLLRPNVVHVAIPKRTLNNEAELKAWLAEVVIMPINGLIMLIFGMNIRSALFTDSQSRLYVWLFGQPDRAYHLN